MTEISSKDPGTRTADVTTVRVIQKTGKFDYPELWARVFVVGDEQFLFPRMLSLARCWKAESVEDADIVLFTGGVADVSPALYGKDPHRSTRSDPLQDVRDIEVFREAVSLGVPMVGVCRGAQFLHVANNGKLYQDVDNHGKTHSMWCPKDMRKIMTSSVHHQSCVWQPGMTVLADAHESKKKWLDDKICYTPPVGATNPAELDIEAFWYGETACLGVQGHPEYPGYEEFTKWFLTQILDYIVYNPEIGYSGNSKDSRQRLKRDIREQRKWREPETFEKFMKEYA